MLMAQWVISLSILLPSWFFSISTDSLQNSKYYTSASSNLRSSCLILSSHFSALITSLVDLSVVHDLIFFSCSLPSSPKKRINDEKLECTQFPSSEIIFSPPVLGLMECLLIVLRGKDIGLDFNGGDLCESEGIVRVSWDGVPLPLGGGDPQLGGHWEMCAAVSESRRECERERLMYLKSWVCAESCLCVGYSWLASKRLLELARDSFNPTVVQSALAYSAQKALSYGSYARFFQRFSPRESPWPLIFFYKVLLTILSFEKTRRNFGFDWSAGKISKVTECEVFVLRLLVLVSCDPCRNLWVPPRSQSR